MKEPIRDKARLDHILQAIDRLQTYAGGLSKNELEQDVLRYYDIVNFQVDGDVVWSVIHGDIVELKVHILDYIENTNWDEWNKQDFHYV